MPNFYNNKFGKNIKFNTLSSKAAMPKSTFRLICDHSVKETALFFTNRLERCDLKNDINTQVLIVKNMINKPLGEEEIPLVAKKYDDFLQHNDDKDRIPGILSLYGVTFKENSILKYNVKTPLGHSESVRVYVQLGKNTNEWDIVLIDPNHLAATEQYREIYTKCNKHPHDIKDIINPY